MRMYRVVFRHKEFGSNWNARTVCVRGFVSEAMTKARLLEKKDAPNTWIEEVTLVAEEE